MCAEWGVLGVQRAVCACVRCAMSSSEAEHGGVERARAGWSSASEGRMHLSEQKIDRAMQGRVERAGRPCGSSELSTPDLSERGQHQRDERGPLRRHQGHQQDHQHHRLDFSQVGF